MISILVFTQALVLVLFRVALVLVLVRVALVFVSEDTLQYGRVTGLTILHVLQSVAMTANLLLCVYVYCQG